MIRFFILALVVFLKLSTMAADNISSKQPEPHKLDTLIGNYPELEKFIFKEPVSNFYLGFGLGPAGFMRSTVYTGLNFFQLHWVTDFWDVEIFSASFGTTVKSSIAGSSIHFTGRSAPKIRILDYLSLGPLVGIEYVKFESVKSRLAKNTFSTPEESFSSQGFIYGAIVSETFNWGDKYKFKVSQVYYQQTYPTDKTTNGWQYVYTDSEIRKKPELIKGGDVFLLEFSFLY